MPTLLCRLQGPVQLPQASLQLTSLQCTPSAVAGCEFSTLPSSTQAVSVKPAQAFLARAQPAQWRCSEERWGGGEHGLLWPAALIPDGSASGTAGQLMVPQCPGSALGLLDM